MLRRVDWLIAIDVSNARRTFKISLTVYKSTGRNALEDFILQFTGVSSFSRKNRVLLVFWDVTPYRLVDAYLVN
jgi:hypothetical protein